MEENVKKQLDQLGDIIDAKLEKAHGQAVDSATGKADVALKGEIANLTQKFTERMDAIEVSSKKRFEANKIEDKSFAGNLTKAISEGALESMRNGTSRSSSFEIKADMTVAADFTGAVIPPQRVPGYKFDPTTYQNIRNLIPIGSTNSDVVKYVKESGYNNAAAPTAEGAALPQSDFDMTAVDANVQKIGTYLRISDEMLHDTPQITSYLSARVPAKLMEVEDDQILDGNGTSPNLNGLVTASSDFDVSATAKFYHAVEAANEFDVLVAALNQLTLSNYRADYILLNPTDFHKILLLKDTTNNYLKDQVYQGLQPNFLGTPIAINNEITAGTFLVGNFAQAAQLWVRDNVSIEFFTQDGINVREGFVTVRVMERVALATYLPNGIINGTFSTAKASLETV